MITMHLNNRSIYFDIHIMNQWEVTGILASSPGSLVCAVGTKAKREEYCANKQ